MNLDHDKTLGLSIAITYPCPNSIKVLLSSVSNCGMYKQVHYVALTASSSDKARQIKRNNGEPIKSATSPLCHSM